MHNGQDSVTLVPYLDSLPPLYYQLQFQFSSSVSCQVTAVLVPRYLPELRAKGASDVFDWLNEHDHTRYALDSILMSPVQDRYVETGSYTSVRGHHSFKSKEEIRNRISRRTKNTTIYASTDPTYGSTLAETPVLLYG